MHPTCAQVLVIFIVEWEDRGMLPCPPYPTMNTVSQPPLQDSNTLSHHYAVSKRAPRYATSGTLTFWQRKARSRKSKRVFTAGDRLVQAKNREQHRRDYQDALERAQAKIQDLAEELRNRFGKYSVEHYFNDLIHRAHKSRSVRRVSTWNAYQKLELERIKRNSSDLYLLWIA